MEKILPYMKFVVAVLGAAVTSALTVIGPDTDLFKVLTIVSAALTAIAVYVVPNRQVTQP